MVRGNMLESVHIRDYALIAALDIEFQPGLNVLSGETGAGKSIVVDALGLALGARAFSDAVRSGAEKASVEAVFRMPGPSQRVSILLAEQEIPRDDEVLILSRTVTTDGRSRAQINGKATTIAALAAIGDELVDLHGQHEHQSLLRSECQMELLDAFAGTTDAAQTMRDVMSRLSHLQREIHTIESNERDRARQSDFLRYEIGEIDAAGIYPGEEEELRGRLHLITHSETIFSLANTAYAALYESETSSALDEALRALNGLEALASIDERFAEQRNALQEACAAMENVASELREYTNRIEFDPEELDEVNRRLSIINDLKRKYGPDIAAILDYRAKAAVSLGALDCCDERLSSLRKEHDSLLETAQSQADLLSKNRKKMSGNLDRQVMTALHELDMPHASFSTQIETIPLCANGIDKISFLLSANAGEPLKPLRQVASGGEISRIMLAIKAVFAEQDTVPVLIFDEIDAGIGGAAARRVAEKLSVLSSSHQVICITHLPQIAAAANAQFLVRKALAGERSATMVDPLNTRERESEIARLLDGSISKVSLDHARSLLAEFKKNNPDKTEKRKVK